MSSHGLGELRVKGWTLFHEQRQFFDDLDDDLIRDSFDNAGMDSFEMFYKFLSPKERDRWFFVYFKMNR